MWMHDKLRCAITLASDTRHGYSRLSLSLLPLPTPPTHTTRRHKRFTNPHSRSFTTHAPSQEPAPLSAASRRLEVERRPGWLMGYWQRLHDVAAGEGREGICHACLVALDLNRGLLESKAVQKWVFVCFVCANGL